MRKKGRESEIARDKEEMKMKGLLKRILNNYN